MNKISDITQITIKNDKCVYIYTYENQRYFGGSWEQELLLKLLLRTIGVDIDDETNWGKTFALHNYVLDK